MQCPACGMIGMNRYSKMEVDEGRTLWSCMGCCWIGRESFVKSYEVTHAKRFLTMCEESLCPESFGQLLQIMEELESTRRIVILKEKGGK